MRIKHLLKGHPSVKKGKPVATGFSLLVIVSIFVTLGSIQSVGAVATAKASQLPGVTSAAGETTGTTWTGEKGITETTAQVMQRESAIAALPAKTHPPKPLRRANRQNLKQNPNSPAVAESPVTTNRIATHPYLPQTTGVEFTGATLADTGAYPPDTMGTVGPGQFIVAVNGRIRSFNKSSGAADGVLNTDTDVFFNSVMTPPVNNNFTSDPKIRYDRLTQRWFVIIIDVPGQSGTLPNRVLLAVSDAASNGVITGSTVWTYYFFQGDSTNFFDYPTLGVDANALYIGGNVFSTSTGSFVNTTGFVVRKSSILSGGPIVVTAFPNLLTSSTGLGPYTPQGVDNFDASTTVGYFIGVDNSSFGLLQIRRISNPGGTPTISGNLTLPVASTYYPLTVPHLGNTGGSNGNLDALDDRLFMAVIRNGSLWTAHNIRVNSAGVGTSSGDRDGSRWYQISVPTASSPTLVQSGTVFDSTSTNPLNYWIPSIMVSGQGHVAMGFSAAGNNSYASAATIGRLAGDSAGTMQMTPVIYEAGAAAYNPPGDTGASIGARRWGDYSYTSLDPDDDMTMWTIQEFTSSLNTYGVRAVKLIAPPPATPASASTTVSSGQPSVNVTITGTSVSGSGFYDPGTSFAKRLSASVSGGVVVNSVTYVDPTHVTLNISTLGVSAGAKDVTITNPDGQSRIGSGILNVNLSCTVTTTADDGTAGSFRSVVNNAVSANCQNVDLTQLSPNSTITLTQAGGGGVTVGSGITLLGPSCGANGPTLTISGAGVTGDGLTLNGATVNGLWVKGFGGRQIVAKPLNARNVLFCVKTSKT
ncbi:MAG TPA: hypothetical protein VH186_20340 [Chloroflexia bacterium]|nr:hypothetical protein [Chloroflexia bacterium]